MATDFLLAGGGIKRMRPLMQSAANGSSEPNWLRFNLQKSKRSDIVNLYCIRVDLITRKGDQYAVSRFYQIVSRY